VDIECQNKGRENTMMKKALMTALVIGLAGILGGAHAQLIPAWSESAPVAEPIVVSGELAVTRVVETTRTTGQGSEEGLRIMQETLAGVSSVAEALGHRCSNTTMQGGPASQQQMVELLSASGHEVPAGTEDLRVFRTGNTLKFSRAYTRGTISGECLLN